MCLSRAWFRGDNIGEPVMEDIAKIRIEKKRVVFSSLFGEERSVEAHIEEVDFTRNRIILRRNCQGTSVN